jgi:hypothetical protein
MAWMRGYNWRLGVVAWTLVRAWQRAWVADIIEVAADKIRVTRQGRRQKSANGYGT